MTDRTNTISLWHRMGRGALLTAFLIMLFPPTAAGAPPGATRIAVVKSLELPEYGRALDGFLAALTATGYDPVTLPFILERPDSEGTAVWTEVRAARPDLILAFGTRAAKAAAENVPDVPVVYSMVLLPPSDSGSGALAAGAKNLTGATLNIPLETQLEEIVRVFPSARRLGMISDPSRTRSVVVAAQQLAARHGLELKVAWVQGEQMIPDALRALQDSIDVLWMVPDETVLTPRSARFIIFELIKAGVPVMGLSSAYVKAGALIALDCDYADIGRQAGELAVRILAGQLPERLPRTAPRVFMRALNLKVRDHMHIPINEAVIKDSNVVIF